MHTPLNTGIIFPDTQGASACLRGRMATTTHAHATPHWPPNGACTNALRMMTGKMELLELLVGLN